jgi:hypothetical protein
MLSGLTTASQTRVAYSQLAPVTCAPPRTAVPASGIAAAAHLFAPEAGHSAVQDGHSDCGYDAQHCELDW